MQYILTEEEYTKLKQAADNHQYCDTEILLLNMEIEKLKSDYKELNSRYTKLLVFGVSSSNERLKGKLWQLE